MPSIENPIEPIKPITPFKDGRAVAMPTVRIEGKKMNK